MTNKIKAALESEGYATTDHPRINSRAGFEGIAYSDGSDIEGELLATLKGVSDLSVLSSELQSKCLDWVTTYHFSHNRANLLRPFESILRGSVLEIGAGCGAITRYLGETAEVVVAVEGSHKRCEINAERIRDLDNVLVVFSELSSFETALKFDTVVVVGVLEYAALFLDSPNPHLDFLIKAKSFLNPGGTLLLAIENKIGLKYFAGAPEDHLGASMAGIEGRYSEKGIRTFSHSELKGLANSAGFQSNFLHSPVPDYKLVRALVTEEGVSDDQFNSAEIQAQLTSLDPQIPPHTNFNLQRAWRVIGEAKLDGQLANSFLLEAKLSKQVVSSVGGSLAFWYGRDRSRKYLREKVFSRTTGSSEIDVTESKLDKIGEPPDTQRRFLQILSPDSKYLEGNSYESIFQELLGGTRWSITDVVLAINVFLDRCGEWAGANNLEWPKVRDWSARIDGSLLDLVPQNVRILEDGSIKPFDQEWKYQGYLTLGHIAFRSVLLSVHHAAAPWDGAAKNVTILETITELCKGLGLSNSQILNSFILESELTSMVSGKDIDYEEFVGQLNGALFQSTTLEQIQTERDALQTERDALQTERDALLQSISYKITRPIRVFYKLLNRSGKKF